jgi:PAS domain S-box-containing protein
MDSILEAIIGSTSDAVITADDQGRVITWNPAAERIFGYSKDEVIGGSLTILMPERFRDLHDRGMQRVVDTGETRVIGRPVLLTGLHKDGTEFPIELSLATWLTEGTRFFSGIIRDVSDREAALEEVSRSEEQMRAIMSSANDAIICADQTGHVLLWNPAAEALFGFTEEEMTGKLLTEIIPDRFREAHDAGLKRVRSGGPHHVIGSTAELAAVRRDGTEFPVELSLGTWRVGEKHFFCGILRDISGRKKAEEDLRAANEALDEKNQELEALSAKLAKYLSKQVYESIFSGQKDVRVESYRKNLTVFFSDIEGFTELTDSMEAEPLSELLNSYLSEMSEIANAHGGTIDKFIGDGIMIFFGDPESKGQKEDALACVRMALAMRHRLFELREEWIDKGLSRNLRVRMGVNTGFCTVGNFGSENRLDYTIVGGQVNMTARLEAAAEPDEILISHATYGLIKDEILCTPSGEISVKGIAYPQKTYRVLGPRDEVGEALQPISDVREGFRLVLDPGSFDPASRDEVRESLRRAMKALDELAREGEPPS